MKPPTLNELKRELSELPPAELVKVCLRLAKYKKENKELLHYILFDSNYEPAYIERVNAETDQAFSGMNTSTLYFAKKSIRKILKLTTKYIRYSGNKQTEVELLIHFCTKLKQSGISIKSSNSLSNLYLNQVRKIHTTIGSLHEDLQHDYLEEIAALNL